MVICLSPLLTVSALVTCAPDHPSSAFALAQAVPEKMHTISRRTHDLILTVRPRFPTETALGGELYATYNSKDFFGRDEHTKFYVMGVVVATEFLHKRGFVHRGLMQENVLLIVSFVEELNNYEMMATDVIIVAENIDHETTKDLGFESFDENRNIHCALR